MILKPPLPDWFDGLVSPKTGLKLYRQDNYLIGKGGIERFDISGDIARLLVPELSDQALGDELEAMASLPVFGVSYFRKEFLNAVSRELYGLLNRSSALLKVIEIGGGDGQFARHFLDFELIRVFICDIYEGFLKLAPPSIRKICCDARYPYFEENGLDLAIFWVSLHHFPDADREMALKTAVKSLKPGGVLALFEPNVFFLPRHILLKTRLGEDVYFDKEEKPLSYIQVRETLHSLGMIEVRTKFIQPPYSLKFVKKLKRWPFYFLVVELLYIIDKYLNLPFSTLLAGWSESVFRWIRQYSASYFLSVYRKP